VSSQDFSPAPYPLYAENGVSGPYAFFMQARARERYWLYCLLFALTLLTTTIVGEAMQADFNGNLPFDVESSFALYLAFWRHPAGLLQGLPYSLTLLATLLAHEFGHYLAAMYHRVDASLPYFMPSPLLGTFGAFIRVRSPIYSKRVLFDIGIAGPLAGFVFLLPALAVGLAFSKVIPGIAHQGSLHFGVPLLQWLMESAIFPGAKAADIYLHPVARAAWVGMFATAMNLLPIGQLDGGHIVYSFFPRWHGTVSKVLCVLMLIPGAVVAGQYLGVRGLPASGMWTGWSVWGLVLLWLGRRHPLIHDPTELTPGRGTLGWIALIIFILCFTFEPIAAGGL
jgi:membrane-associated protease RseP (regulator of RpoE activity)